MFKVNAASYGPAQAAIGAARATAAMNTQPPGSKKAAAPTASRMNASPANAPVAALAPAPATVGAPRRAAATPGAEDDWESF